MLTLNLLFIGPFLLFLYTLIVLQSLYFYYYDYFTTTFFQNDSLTPAIFDFIIVGAGSAGCVLANRLSLHHKVLLIEAGSDPLPIQSVPGFTVEFLHKPQYDWMYETVVQKYSHFGQINQNVSRWPRGKSLGGSSNLNYMMYVRANPNDYDQWSNLTQDPFWKYDNLLQYFKKSLNYKGKFQHNEKHYGRGKGPQTFLNVQSHSEREPLLPYFLDGGQELGYEAVNDLNGPQREGFGTLEHTQKDGARAGTYGSFIKPIEHRANLVISRYSHATKIQLDKNKRATGIWYVRHGVKKLAKARKEIILSGGSIGSPHLLMLSGIGPAGHLKSVGIKPKINLPVGQNLVDHIAVPFPPAVVGNTENFTSLFPDQDYSIPAFYDYYFNGKGPLTMSAPFNGQAFITTSGERNVSGVDWPNIQMLAHTTGSYEFMPQDFSRGYGFTLENLWALWGPIKDSHCVTFLNVLVRPKSIGQLTLKNNNPFTHPLIDPNYLQDPHDVAALIESAHLVVKLLETKAFQKLKVKLHTNPLPGCAHHKLLSDQYWDCYIRHMSMTLYHPVGTCRMGRGHEDPSAVVDSSLRVLHTGGSLRVIDASIMPKIVNGNTNAPTIAIAEAGADKIREYWSQQYLVSPRKFWPFQLFYLNFKCYYSQLV